MSNKTILAVSTALLLGSGLLAQPVSTADRAQQNIQLARERLGDRLATTAAEVIQRHVEAIGGRVALEAVHTLRITGRNIILSNETRPIIRCYQAPDLLYQITTPEADSYLCSDGRTVYTIRDSVRTEMTQPWTAALKHERIDGNFLDYDERGIVCEYIGLESFTTEPTVFYHVKRTFPDGYFDDLFFDVDAGLLRMSQENGDTSSRRAYYEYRESGNILIPRLRLTVFDGVTPPHLFVVDSVEVNGPLPESLSR